jgi:hypothetical protein
MPCFRMSIAGSTSGSKILPQLVQTMRERLMRLAASRRHCSTARSLHGRRHMKPGLRGRYWAQLPKWRDDIRSIGNLIRMPYSNAAERAASLAPGKNADTCEAPL